MNVPHDSFAMTRIASVEQPLLYQFCRIEMPQGEVLGEESFRLVGFQGNENVSDLFEFQLELHGNSQLDDVPDIDIAQIIGRPVTVAIAGVQTEQRELAHLAFLRVPDGRGDLRAFSVFNGIVASFAIDMPGVYHVTVRPAAWRMTLTNHYRIHPRCSIREAIERVCREHRVSVSLEGLKGDDNIASARIQDWLQAGESDFDFIRRLMGKAHIFFYFEHRVDGHTMVFANRPAYPPARPGDEPLRYTYTEEDEIGLHEADIITQYNYRQSLGSSGVHSTFSQVHEAWNVSQPTQPLAMSTSINAGSAPDVGELPFNQYKIVQYGFSGDSVQHYARTTGQALSTADLQLSGSSKCPFFRVGHRFGMVAMHPDVRPELDGCAFVLTQVQHSATLDGIYQNQFTATVVHGLISAASLQDTQQGAVLATVTDAQGNATVRDWPYYVPDDFTLGRQELVDRQGGRLSAKGVFVRFSTAPQDSPPVWVKLSSQMQSIPEVGCAVWVSRANDESELPEIQNTVQSDGTRTITDSKWTSHSSVGNSYSASYGDSRSVRFGQAWSRADVDRAVFLVESAYAEGKFRDVGYSRGANYGYSESEEKENGLLSKSCSYGSNYGYSWGKESKSFSMTGSSYHESVTGKCDTTLTSTEGSDPEESNTVQVSKSTVHGDSYSVNIAHGKTRSVSTHHDTVSSESTVNADSENRSTVTGKSTNHTRHSTVQNVTTIGAQSSSSAIGASNSNDVIGSSQSNSAIGVSQSNAAVGVSQSNSVTGLHNHNGLTGASADTSLTGATNSTSITGAAVSTSVLGSHTGTNVCGSSSTVNVTGSSTSVNMAGTSTSIDILGSGMSLSVKGSTVGIDISGPSIHIPVILLVM
jgi:type VI secretion system secreted protein VgrG